MKIDLLSRSQLEILNKRGLRYHLQDAQKDYFLAVALWIFVHSAWKDHLVFKGGTAIYHCYLDQLRFSKDLDFTSQEKLEPEDIEKIFSQQQIFRIKNIEEKKFGLDFSLQYQGLLAQSDTLEVDINTHQKVLLKPQWKKYVNSYGLKLSCRVMDIKEILAEKIRTLCDRARPRDPYDLVILRKKLNLDLKEALKLLASKEMHSPLDSSRIKENLKICLDRFEKEMKELYYEESVTKEEILILAKDLMALIG